MIIKAFCLLKYIFKSKLKIQKLHKRIFFAQNKNRDFRERTADCKSNQKNMKNNKFLEKFFNGKGFYVALGICMITIGISAWTTMSGLSTDKNPAQEQTSEKQQIVIEAPANKAESNIEDTRSQNESPSDAKDKTASTNEENPNAQPVAKYFTYPVIGEVIKKFSDSELQYSVTYNDMRIHTGMDIKASAGVSIKSAGDGKVLSTLKESELGYTVRIDHGNGIVGVYAGLSSAFAVEKGDTVKSGTNLGSLGTVNNECLDAPHLHLEFLKNGKPIDPMTLISK